ncbi:MAG: T9SS type A sorting domain-containing protein, partial [Chryseolinea sp.]
SSPEDATLKMFDVLGRKVKEVTIVSNSPNVISVNELQAGNYIIAIQSSKSTKHLRIQKID